MAGTGDRRALTEDWMLPTPSPRTLMSSFLNEEFSSGPFSNLFGENISNKIQDGSEKSKSFVDLSKEEPAIAGKTPFQKDLSLEPKSFGANQKSSLRGGLAQRMAARAGFSVPKIDTSRVGSSAVVRSPVTIPPGLSPTTLLESPVFLPNAMAQPSPTTGKLPFLMPVYANPKVLSAAKKDEDCSIDDDAFSFQPFSKPPSFSTAEKDYSAFYLDQSSANINQPEFSLQSRFPAVRDVAEETIVKPKRSDSMFGNGDPSPADEQEDGETNQNEEYSSAALGAPAEDGYNWRKYGQKQVNNSKNPRSHYKCTHQDCTVKKKVEHLQDGHITEITYKGIHNHPMLPPNHRSSDDPDSPGSQPSLNPASLRENATDGYLQNVRSECIEIKPSACLTTPEFADTCVMESYDTIDVSSTLSNEEDDRATHGAISMDCAGEEDEHESKRRKLDASSTTTITTVTAASSTIDMGAAASRAVREPRVVVQTTSEVDILDDGYRWRKYGQKVVKGNPNPRSYYKCTHPGCSVRKHVERASHDLKSVITTYEGKHNHEVPAARNSGHSSSGSGSAPVALAPQASSIHRRPENAQASFGQLAGAAAFGSFSLPPRDQFGPSAGNFCFGMVPPGMTLPMPSLGATATTKISGQPSTMQGFPGLVMPGGEPKAEPLLESSFSAVNEALSAYQQMMSRRPLGPHM